MNQDKYRGEIFCCIYQCMEKSYIEKPLFLQESECRMIGAFPPDIQFLEEENS